LIKHLFYKENTDKIIVQENDILKFDQTAKWLLTDIDKLKLSKTIKQKFVSKNIETVRDIVFLKPLHIKDYKLRQIIDLKENEYCAVKGIITSLKKGKFKSFTVYDGSAYLNCNFFGNSSYVNRLFYSLKVGSEIVCKGKTSIFNNKIQMNHPILEHISDFKESSEIEYPSILNMRNKTVIKTIESAFDIQPEAPYDYLPYTIIAKNRFIFLNELLDNLHKAKDSKAVERRLKYEEAFFIILSLALEENEVKKYKSIPIQSDKNIINDVERRVGFSFTNDQRKASETILYEINQDKPMLKLLQGDVGCGKTVVALTASLAALRNNLQVAIMAPTQQLAVQIFKESRKVLSSEKFNVELLISSTKNKQDIYDKLENKHIDCIVGTHSLLQDKIKFQNLGFIVIDEQHRFGVEQRKLLSQKGFYPHTLIMSATPIPRTLATILYSKTSLTTIKEKPEGRLKIKTMHFVENNRKKAYELARREMDKKHQVYIVAPLIEDSEKQEETLSAVKIYDSLRKGYFKNYKIALLHSKIDPNEKNKIVNDFRSAKIDCIISTTVIEVGIDSPSATVMIVENAEKFGLSQLHQLRGRIGRSSLQSYAVFITKKNISSIAQERISALLTTDDGFEISEIDYRLRGSGEILGTRQHGKNDFNYINIFEDGELIEKVKKDVEYLIEIQYPINVGLKKILEYQWQKRINYINVG